MKKHIFYLAFVEGSMILAAELVGGSIIVPFYGNGLTVWTFILGITMFSLAIGYLVGAYAVRKINAEKLISVLLPIIAFFFFLMPLIAQGTFKTDASDSFELTVLKGILPVLIFPLTLLGILSTVLVQCLINQGYIPGKASGTIYGISTLAGILVAILIGFVLLENCEINSIVFGFSTLALTGSIFFYYDVKSKLRKSIAIVTLVIISLIFFENNNSSVENEISGTKVLYKNNGILGEVKVVDDYITKTRMFYVNNALQSTLGDDGIKSLPYVKYIGFFLSHRGKGEKLLLAGMGGGNLLRDLQPLGFKIDIVELDKRVIKSAVEYFGINLKNTNVTIDDARHFINISKKKYDIIVLDLSIGETIPSNVYTIQSFGKMKKMLSKNGLITLHLFSSEKGESINSIRSLGKTMQAAGFHVYLFNTEPHPELPSPYIFVASKKEIDFSNMNYNNYGMNGKRIFPSPLGDVRKFDYSNGIILTDDKPMLEIFQQDIVAFFRKSYINDYSKMSKE